LFFYDYNLESLIKAWKQFDQMKFDINNLTENAKKFDEKVFVANIKKLLVY